VEAHQLALSDGIRPCWQETPLSKGEVPPPGEGDNIIALPVPCENIGCLLHPGTVDKVLDSNNRSSYGLLMFQSSTWQGVESGAGFTGSPPDTLDAIDGVRWSILHGYLAICGGEPHSARRSTGIQQEAQEASRPND
jgi:hypothetical protein